MVPAGSPFGACRTSSRKMSSRVSWANAASEVTAFDVFIFPKQWKCNGMRLRSQISAVNRSHGTRCVRQNGRCRAFFSESHPSKTLAVQGQVGADSSWGLGEGESHFVGGLEAEGFVEGAAGGTGVEGDVAEALVAAPIEHGLQKLFCEAAAAGFGFGVHIEDPGALGEGFAGVPGPVGDDDSAAGDDAGFGSFGEPGFVGAEGQGCGEIFPGRLIDPVKLGGVAMSHVFEHGSAVMNKVV